MTEPLDSIIQSVRDGAYMIREHYWEKVVEDPQRPLPTAVIASIGNDDPEIIENYPTDVRGASCLILGVNGSELQIHSVVSYTYDPIRIVTAYYPDDRFIDGRIRRKR